LLRVEIAAAGLFAFLVGAAANDLLRKEKAGAQGPAETLRARLVAGPRRLQVRFSFRTGN
jgi:hypothetical protein